MQAKRRTLVALVLASLTAACGKNPETTSAVTAVASLSNLASVTGVKADALVKAMEENGIPYTGFERITAHEVKCGVPIAPQPKFTCAIKKYAGAPTRSTEDAAARRLFEALDAAGAAFSTGAIGGKHVKAQSVDCKAPLHGARSCTLRVQKAQPGLATFGGADAEAMFGYLTAAGIVQQPGLVGAQSRQTLLVDCWGLKADPLSDFSSCAVTTLAGELITIDYETSGPIFEILLRRGIGVSSGAAQAATARAVELSCAIGTFPGATYKCTYKAN